MKRYLCNINRPKKANGAFLLLLIFTALIFTFSLASAGTNLLFKVDVAPENLPLGDVVLMNPGDMEDLGLSGGEVITFCRYDDPTPKRCVEVRPQYGAGVTSGSVVMASEKIDALGVEPKKSYWFEITVK